MAAETGWRGEEGVFKFTNQKGEPATCVALHPTSFPLVFLCTYCDGYFTKNTIGKHHNPGVNSDGAPVSGARPCKYFKEQGDGNKKKKNNKKVAPAKKSAAKKSAATKSGKVTPAKKSAAKKSAATKSGKVGENGVGNNYPKKLGKKEATPTRRSPRRESKGGGVTEEENTTAAAAAPRRNPTRGKKDGTKDSTTNERRRNTKRGQTGSTEVDEGGGVLV